MGSYPGFGIRPIAPIIARAASHASGMARAVRSLPANSPKRHGASRPVQSLPQKRHGASRPVPPVVRDARSPKEIQSSDKSEHSIAIGVPCTAPVRHKSGTARAVRYQTQKRHGASRPVPPVVREARSPKEIQSSDKSEHSIAIGVPCTAPVRHKSGTARAVRCSPPTKAARREPSGDSVRCNTIRLAPSR